MILAAPATAYSTEVTVRRLATDGLTVINQTKVSYQWMEANLPVYGDGNTYYYFQGPIFENEWEDNYGVQFPEYRADWPGGTAPGWLDSEEIWDRYWNGTSYVQMEETNWQGKNLGKLKGTNIKDLCDLVGGLPQGNIVRVIATDNVKEDLPYSAIYTPTEQLGPYVLTWWSVDAGESGSTSGYTGPDYPTGMRATFFSDNSRNQNGTHVAGLGDQAEGLPEQYWYRYAGEYPSMGGWTLKYVDRIHVFSNDPVPPPETDFLANTKTGIIQNGNFELGTTLSPWTYNLATRHTGSATYRHGNASVKLAATVGNSAWIQQDLDISNIGSIKFWRYYFGGQGKYMQVLVDGTIVANYTETSSLNGYETVDISSYGFSGTHTIKFNAVNSASSGTFTVYLDDIEDYGPGTTGDAPLIVQFKDLSTKMEDTAHTSWAWDFDNNGVTDSTSQNPLYTYVTNGTYTVKLTATNAAGSDTEIKNGYIRVGFTTPQPVAGFSASPLSGTDPLRVIFTDESTNIPTSWIWEYRNDTVGWTQFNTTQNPTVTLPAGTYDIRLTAGNDGGTDDETKEDYITVTSPVLPPVAGFSASPLSGTDPLRVIFTDESTNIPTSWIWEYRNDTVGWTQFNTTQNPTVTFPAGTYDIRLTAGNDGGTDDETKEDYITATTPPYIDIDVVGSISNWNFMTGTNDDAASVDLSVSTNTDSWAVSARDALDGSKPAGTEGRMAEWGGSAYVPSGKVLTDAMQVKVGTGNFVTLSGSGQDVVTGTSPGTISHDLTMRQVIEETDPSLEGTNSYRIVITFTGSAA